MTATLSLGLPGLLPQLPLYLAWLVGIVLALMRWRRHPRVSLLVVAAVGAFIVDAVLGVLSGLWMQQVLRTARMPWVNGPPVELQLTIISVVRIAAGSFLTTVGFGSLIGAALVSRRPRKAADVPEQK